MNKVNNYLDKIKKSLVTSIKKKEYTKGKHALPYLLHLFVEQEEETQDQMNIKQDKASG